MVLVSKTEKRAIYTYLLKEGVIVVRKDAYLPRHQSISDVPNLKVMMIVKSLVSRGYLNNVFNWQWNYYTVTNKGVTFLAKALGKFFIFPALASLFLIAVFSFNRSRCERKRCPIHLQAEEDCRDRSQSRCRG